MRQWVLVAFMIGVAGCADGARQTSPVAPRPPAATLSAASASSASAPSADREDKVLEGVHFDVLWGKGAATEAEARRVLDRGELARNKFIELLGKERVGERKIRVRLAGDAGPSDFPYVDPESGDIVLVRFPGTGGGHEAPLAHELVHAVRLSRWANAEHLTNAALFWEEGFAELLAREAGLPSMGFPLYGESPDVAAASFVARGEALPIRTLVAEHRPLNFQCMAQAYVQRISFMLFVRERVGLMPMIAAAYVDTPLDIPTLEKTIGAKIDDLAAAHDQMLAATAARADAREQGAKYRETTPIRFLPVCKR